jgi:predicted alpha-1,2-mannosidase
MSLRALRHGLCAAACVLAAGVRGVPAADDLAAEVDPFIGTGGHGHTFPGATVPFGMVQLSPDTRLTGWDGCSGYHFDDHVIYGFSHTHLSGTGISDYGDVLLLPSTGALKLRTNYENPAGDGYGEPFRKSLERAEAGYYRVHLDGSGIEAELTATLRSGWHRYTFPKSEDAHVLLDLQHRDTVLESSLAIVDDHTVEGMRRSRAWAEDQVVYFVARFDRPFDGLLAVDDVLRPGLKEASGSNLKAVLRYRTEAGARVQVKLGLSAVDLDGARRNLEAEAPGWDFDHIRAAARRAWNEALQAVRVEGGSRAQRTIFYTGLYHTMVQPNVFQDVDGRYRGIDKRIHRAEGYTRHTVFSLWDTFRAAHPLYTLIQRKRTVDFIRTFLDIYREGGRLPVWELAGNETDCMIGYHAVSVILDAWAKGIRGFDPELALEAMKATADGDRGGLPAYRQHGYLSADDEAEDVSKTAEYAYDDWCIGRFAGLLGRREDEERFLKRSGSWQHLVDADGFLHPRFEGRWLMPFDPAEVTFHYTEANAWQYSLFVPHDLAGLTARLGGAAALERRLDALFSAESRTRGREQPDITGLVGQYAHGNEPSHHMAYLYACAGAPHKTQALVRRLRDEMYAARPDGLVGNEDCGQMSAWFVLSALGFYPATPGLPEYVLGTPLFDKATLVLESGRRFALVARRPSPRAAYVHAVRLNGRPYSRAVLPHDVILAGGELLFELGERPSSWGTREEDRPRSAVGGIAVTPAPVAAGPDLAGGPTTLTLVAAGAADAIHYTLDGGTPDLASPRYGAPLTVVPPASVTFRALRGDVWSPVVQAMVRYLDPRRHLTLRSPVESQYSGGGDQALLDGRRGSTDFRLGRWQGFEGVELDLDLDLGEIREVRHLSLGFLHDQNSWIFLPQQVRYSVSDDGQAWRDVGSVGTDLDPHQEAAERREFRLDLPPTRARHVRVQTRSFLQCPAWHKGAGHKAHLFADELTVE